MVQRRSALKIYLFWLNIGPDLSDSTADVAAGLSNEVRLRLKLIGLALVWSTTADLSLTVDASDSFTSFLPVLLAFGACIVGKIALID